MIVPIEYREVQCLPRSGMAVERGRAVTSGQQIFRLRRGGEEASFVHSDGMERLFVFLDPRDFLIKAGREEIERYLFFLDHWFLAPGFYLDDGGEHFMFNYRSWVEAADKVHLAPPDDKAWDDVRTWNKAGRPVYVKGIPYTSMGEKTYVDLLNQLLRFYDGGSTGSLIRQIHPTEMVVAMKEFAELKR